MVISAVACYHGILIFKIAQVGHVPCFQETWQPTILQNEYKNCEIVQSLSDCRFIELDSVISLKGCILYNFHFTKVLFPSIYFNKVREWFKRQVEASISLKSNGKLQNILIKPNMFLIRHLTLESFHQRIKI